MLDKWKYLIFKSWVNGKTPLLELNRTGVKKKLLSMQQANIMYSKSEIKVTKGNEGHL
jgi:hypothetical protein